jgi:predicted phosphatase
MKLKYLTLLLCLTESLVDASGQKQTTLLERMQVKRQAELLAKKGLEENTSSRNSPSEDVDSHGRSSSSGSSDSWDRVSSRSSSTSSEWDRLPSHSEDWEVVPKSPPSHLQAASESEPFPQKQPTLDLNFLVTSQNEFDDMIQFIASKKEPVRSLFIDIHMFPTPESKPIRFNTGLLKQLVPSLDLSLLQAIALTGVFSINAKIDRTNNPNGMQRDLNDEVILGFLNQTRTSSTLKILAIENELASDKVLLAMEPNLQQNPALEAVSVASRNFTNYGLSRFFNAVIQTQRNLKLFSVKSWNLRDLEIETLIPILQINPSLEEVVIHGIFKDEALTQLLNILQTCRNLRRISIKGHFSEEAKIHFAQQLQSVSNTLEIDIEGLQALSKRGQEFVTNLPRRDRP